MPPLTGFVGASRHRTESIESTPEIVASSGTAEEVDAHEIGDQIAAAIAKLPEDQKTAIVLSEYQGMSYAEIAGVMRCSEKSVESRLYRAKQTLRDSAATPAGMISDCCSFNHTD